MDEYKKEIKEAIYFAEHLKFDKEHPWHRNLMALYCSLIEYSDSLIYLVENEKRISVPIVFRGLLEAYVDFKNLSEDKLYGYHMEASFNKEWLKLTKEAYQNNNEFLQAIGDTPELAQKIQEYELHLNELKNNGYKALNQFEKFDRANMNQEYKSIYNVVCSHSHNNISSLIERFFIINEADNDFELALFKEPEIDEFEHYLVTGKQYLRYGNNKIHTLLETGYQERFSLEY